MTYQPHLIANFSTGYVDRLQPWLNVDDAQLELYDGFTYRGTMSKREGYTYFANGLHGGAPYRESRIVHELAAVPMVGAINSINQVFTLAGTPQIARGSITITGSTPPQVLVDNGLGGFTGAGTGTVNYITGAISITFTAAPTAGTVLITYSAMADDPVMMIASFYTATNIRELIVASTQYVNRYNSTLNILEDISPASAYTGNSHNFFTWVNYPDANDDNRLLFANNVDVIQSYDGTTVTDYAYTSAEFSTITCLLMFEYKDRLVLLRTNEDGTIFPRRIRVSGTGQSCDIFDSTAIGAGFIDIPDNTWIMGAAFNRDDLIIFTEGSTWTLKYTGNDAVPFVLDRIDESRGSQAPFAAITYLNRTTAASPRGLIITDGYRVEREDMEIPDFSFNEIDSNNFDLCFAGSVDVDRDHYLIYPPEGQTQSKRILTTNYDEDNFAVYRLPLSCMGSYIVAFDVTWNDLVAPAFNDWDDFAAVYQNWYSFSFSQGDPISIGGGHHGEIWRIGIEDDEDNVVRIYNITIIDETTLEVTTDWNNYSLNEDDLQKGADVIFFEGVGGMVEINNQQFAVIQIVSNNVFRVTIPSTLNPSAYTSGGTAVRVIPMDVLMKKFNPYVEMDKKVRCGWLYMYVDSTGTSLTRNIAINQASQANPCQITTSQPHGLQTSDQVNIFGVVGMTELNNIQYVITVTSSTSFTLDGIDSLGFTPYVSGGYVAAAVPAKLDIQIIVDDVQNITQLNNGNLIPYEGNCTNLIFQKGAKKWYKVFINQTGRFIQFRLKNQQAGSTINIQAMMPGFQPVGRLL